MGAGRAAAGGNPKKNKEVAEDAGRPRVSSSREDTFSLRMAAAAVAAPKGNRPPVGNPRAAVVMAYRAGSVSEQRDDRVDLLVGRGPAGAEAAEAAAVVVHLPCRVDHLFGDAFGNVLGERRGISSPVKTAISTTG